MPTITLVSPKGGAGKTTAALLLAAQLAEAYDVALLDADPNQPIKDWATGGNAPKRLTVITDVTEDNIIDAIDEAASNNHFVVVDLEGTAAQIATFAVTRSDFIIIPTQGSQLDASQAGRAIKVVRDSEKVSRRTIPFAVLLTRTSPTVRARTLAHIERNLVEMKIPTLRTELNEREAFRAVFSFRTTLPGLDPAKVNNIERAVANVQKLALELIDLLAPRQDVQSHADHTAAVV